mgnify:CR=1 FL=1
MAFKIHNLCGVTWFAEHSGMLPMNLIEFSFRSRGSPVLPTFLGTIFRFKTLCRVTIQREDNYPFFLIASKHTYQLFMYLSIYFLCILLVLVTCGPMGRDADSLISSMRALSMTESYAIDPYIPPITFDEAALTSTKQLRVGYLMACDPIETCTASKRSVTMTINALKSHGHEVSVQDVQKKH